jgi:hypothetical protein
MFKAILVDRGVEWKHYFFQQFPGFWEVTKPPNEDFGQFWERTSITYFFPVFVPSPQHQFPPFILFPTCPPHLSVYIHMSM